MTTVRNKGCTVVVPVGGFPSYEIRASVDTYPTKYEPDPCPSKKQVASGHDAATRVKATVQIVNAVQFRGILKHTAQSTSIRWSAILYVWPCCPASAHPVVQPGFESEIIRLPADSFVFKYAVPTAVLATIVGCDFALEHNARQHRFQALKSLNSNARTFWSTVNPLAMTATLLLSGESKERRLVSMFLLACTFNQFRRCTEGAISRPGAFMIMITLWLLAEQLLTTLADLDDTRQSIGSWMLASFTITVVAQVYSSIQRMWRSGPLRWYDNIYVSNGSAIFGDINLQERDPHQYETIPADHVLPHGYTPTQY